MPDEDLSTKIGTLKRLIREDQLPYFTDDADYEFYLERNGGDVEAAAYEMLIVKSEDSKITLVGMTTIDTSSYFKRLASRFKRFNSGILE